MAKYKMAPLPGSFMLFGMIGFIAVAIYTWSGRIAIDWGIAFGTVFFIMFVSSVVSITPSLKYLKSK